MGFPFSSGDVLTAADMNAIGGLVSFTPTFDGITLGNSTVTAQYALVNDLCFYRVQVELGSTSSVTGAIYIHYPFNAGGAYLGAIGGQCQFEDSSGTDYFGMLYRSSATRALCSCLRVDSTFARADAADATTPFTWTTGDRLNIEDWFVPA